MVSMFEAIVLSFIQGITEWFPISSSGHLALMQNIFGFQNLSYDVFLHFAGIFAVLFVFKKDVLKLLSFNNENLKYIVFLLVALIPAGIVGIFFSEVIERVFSEEFYLGIFFVISGIVIYSTKFAGEIKTKLSVYDSLFIGIFQALAIFPGISRSGMTISSGLYSGLSKEEAIKFSFLMSIPLILGASVIKAKELVVSQIETSVLLVSFVVTLLVSLFTIKILIRIIRSDKFYLFGIYNFILGILVLVGTTI